MVYKEKYLSNKAAWANANPSNKLLLMESLRGKFLKTWLLQPVSPIPSPQQRWLRREHHQLIAITSRWLCVKWVHQLQRLAAGWVPTCINIVPLHEEASSLETLAQNWGIRRLIQERLNLHRFWRKRIGSQLCPGGQPADQEGRTKSWMLTLCLHWFKSSL